jgi:hypothetical protein
MKDYNVIWQGIGAFMGPILLVLLIGIKYTNPSFTWLSFLFWAFLPLIMIHETEEYIIRIDKGICKGGFKEYFNLRTFGRLNPPQPDYPLTEGYEFWTNMVVWFFAIISALTIYITPWVGIGLIVFLFVMNGITHTAIFQFTEKGANPGFYTAWLILNPYSVVVLFYAYTTNAFTALDYILGILLGLVVFIIFNLITRNLIKSFELSQEPGESQK